MSENALAFAIEGEFSIYRAAELTAALHAWLNAAPAASALELELSDVSEMDSAGLQLLLSLHRSASQQGHVLCIRAASSAVTEVLRLTALEHLLTSDAEAP